MLRTAVIIVGVTVFTSLMLVAATLRVNGSFDMLTSVSAQSNKSAVLALSGLARESYIYARPLLLSYSAMYRDIADPSSTAAVGSFNALKVLARVEGESAQSIIIKAWLDLRTEPMLLHVPGGRELVNGMEVKDLYGDTVLQIGRDELDANYLFVAWDWEGEVPLGIRSVVRARTDLLSVYSASRVASAAVYESNRSWAGKMALVPMSAYTMQTPPQLAPGLTLPPWNEDLATTKQFIPYLNFVLRFLHPEAEEAQALIRFERIGIIAGHPRAPTRFSGAITAGIDQAREELKALATDTAELMNLEQIEREGLATIGQI